MIRVKELSKKWLPKANYISIPGEHLGDTAFLWITWATQAWILQSYEWYNGDVRGKEEQRQPRIPSTAPDCQSLELTLYTPRV